MGLAEFDMPLGRVEMGIARKIVTLFHYRGKQHVLGSTALMYREHVLQTGDLAYRVLEVVERRRSGIAFVALHECGPLPVAHGPGSGIGEHIDEDMFALQLEKVVSGLRDPFLALRTG